MFQKNSGFASIPIRINESDVKKDFNKFSQKMRCMYGIFEPTENVLEKRAFNVKFKWNPPNGHPALETFLS